MREYDTTELAARESLGETADHDEIREAAGPVAPRATKPIPTGIDLVTPEPWPQPVDGPDLIARLAAALRTHAAIGESAALTIALWLLHAHALPAFAVSPRLVVTSPARRCGKTTLLEVLAHLLPRPLSCADAAPRAVLKLLPNTPSLLIDDAGEFLGRRNELRSVLISGHRRTSAKLLRLERGKPCQIPTFVPAVLALLGDIPEALGACGIEIRLERKNAGETLRPFRPENAEHLAELNRMSAGWAADNMAALRDACRERQPALPAGTPEWKAQNWLPLLVIADAAGQDVPFRARAALAAVSPSASPVSSACELLLAGIAAIFEVVKEQGAEFADANRRRIVDRDRIRSSDLVKYLALVERQPWAELGRNRGPFNPQRLANLLKPFGIAPGMLTFTQCDNDSRTFSVRDRGYHAGQFADAFARYVPGACAADTKA